MLQNPVPVVIHLVLNKQDSLFFIFRLVVVICVSLLQNLLDFYMFWRYPHISKIKTSNYDNKGDE